MNKRGQDPVFLERSSYRQRRLGDAVRMMPVLGVVLMLFPLLSGTSTTSGVGVYLFGVWFLLICGAGFLAARMTQDEPEKDPKPQAPKGGAAKRGATD